MAKKSSSGMPKLVIRVVPDEKAPVPEPLVLLTERDVKAPGAPSKIEWKKLPASKKFEMISLVDNSGLNVFKNININKKKITCDFEPPVVDSANTAYEYTLTIKYKCVDYDTDTRGGPTHGRPVIRN